jgi:O-antigen/teichoic acid export membrane protein
LSIVVPAVALAVVLAPWLIPLAFSGEFASAEPVLEWQLPGEIWRALAWTVGALLLPLGLVRAWLLIGLATVGVQVALAVVLVEPLGLRGVGIAYLGAWIFNAAAALLVVRSAIGYRPRGASARAVIGAVGVSVAIVGAAQLGDTRAVVAGLLLLLAWWAATAKDTLKLVLARTGGA